MGGDPVVALSRVSFSHPLPAGGSRPALRDLSLAVSPGESLVVLGANGAGKSTLAHLLAGVLAPTAGEVRRAPPAADGPPLLPVGLVTQNPEDCFSTPLVREEMGVVLENLERDPEAIDREVSAMLAEVGLAGHAEAHPARLSGGQKQLLAIASVLVAMPPLLVLDEPLTLLDAPSRAEVDRLLTRARGPGAATVFLTSEVEDAARGTRLVILHAGAVVWEGAPSALPQDPETLGQWGLLLDTAAVTAASAAPPPRGAGQGVGPRAEGAEPPGQRPPGGEGNRKIASGAAACLSTGRPSGGLEIEVGDLHFSYDRGTAHARPVLRGVDLAAHPGEVLGVIGANGSGKTTLIQHLNGLLPPQRGSVRVGDRVLEPGVRLRELLHRQVGLVFQFPEKQLFAESVDEDVAAGPEFAGVPPAEVPGRVRAALEHVGLDPAAFGPRAPFALAWGEKRLVALAGVLVLETPCLVLDEPGAGLDPAGRRGVMALLAHLARREGRTVVVVSHHLDDLFRVADRIAVLHEGRVASCGPPSALAGSPDLVRWGLLAQPLPPLCRGGKEGG
jgi:energy-coupling factor transport system ATP-binding protein